MHLPFKHHKEVTMYPDKILDTPQAIYRITCTGEVFSQSKVKIPLVTQGMKWNGEFKTFIKPERKLKTRINSRGYETVRLSGKTKMIHRLVAEYFCNYQPNSDKDVVNHIDGNKLNNHFSNLEWCTMRENLLHARQTGLHKQAKGHKINYKSKASKKIALNNLKDNTKLLPIQVKFARKMVVKRKRNSPYSITALAKRFGVDTTTLSKAINGETFQNI